MSDACRKSEAQRQRIADIERRRIRGESWEAIALAWGLAVNTVRTMHSHEKFCKRIAARRLAALRACDV